MRGAFLFSLILEAVKDANRHVDLVVNTVAFEGADAIGLTAEARCPFGRICAELQGRGGKEASHADGSQRCNDWMGAQDGVNVVARNMVAEVQTQTPARRGEVLHPETEYANKMRAVLAPSFEVNEVSLAMRIWPADFILTEDSGMGQG